MTLIEFTVLGKPEPAKTVWGIDPSTKAVSLAEFSDHGLVTDTEVIDAKGSLRGATRCFVHHWRLEAWVNAHVIRCERITDLGPDLIVVEQPAATGRKVHHASWECLGVLLAVLGSEVACPVLELTPTTWKSRALGNGQASKGQVMEWARREYGYDGQLQDEADAIGIAVAGRTILERDARVAA